MGWTYQHKEKGLPIKDFFINAFDYKNEDGSSGKVVACSSKLGTSYLAYEVSKPDGERAVIGLVCLTAYDHNDYYNFGYKDMSEEMGPNQCDCPEKILKMLTPTTNEYALEWRKNCQETIDKKKSAPKLKAGDIIEFDKPMTFTNGMDYKRLVVESLKPRIFRPEGTYNRVKISKRALESYPFKIVA
jgi:hypothetical protein